jgi:hypothetical protein
MEILMFILNAVSFGNVGGSGVRTILCRDRCCRSRCILAML